MDLLGDQGDAVEEAVEKIPNIVTQLPGVRRLTSTLIMKTVVAHHAPI